MKLTRFSLAIAALGTALAWFTPTFANPCSDPLERVFSTYATAGKGPTMLSDEEIGAAMEQFALNTVSRGFYVLIESQMYLGLEVDGCLLPPIPVGRPLRATRLSGDTPFGTYA